MWHGNLKLENCCPAACLKSINGLPSQKLPLTGSDLLRVYGMCIIAPWKATCLNRYLQMSCGKLLRSEEHTSELQSRFDLVCRLLLEKKKRQQNVTEVHDHIRI